MAFALLLGPPFLGSPINFMESYSTFSTRSVLVRTGANRTTIIYNSQFKIFFEHSMREVKEEAPHLSAICESQFPREVLFLLFLFCCGAKVVTVAVTSVGLLSGLSVSVCLGERTAWESCRYRYRYPINPYNTNIIHI